MSDVPASRPPAQLVVTITVQYPAELGAPPPVLLRVGDVREGSGPVAMTSAPAPQSLAPAAPGSPVPPTSSHAPETVAWQASERAKGLHYASATDEGQHDIWKRELALVIWRFIAGPKVPLARRWFDLDGEIGVPHGPVFPLHTDLANACRRLGVRRLGRAALGFASETPPGRHMASDLPVGGPFRLFAGADVGGVRIDPIPHPVDVDEALRALIDQHNTAAGMEMQRVLAHHTTLKATWDASLRGPYPDTEEAAYAALWALAPLECPDAWERAELNACPALVPLRLQRDPLRPDTGGRRTPATGAAIPAAMPGSEPVMDGARTPATGAPIPEPPGPAEPPAPAATPTEE